MTRSPFRVAAALSIALAGGAAAQEALDCRIVPPTTVFHGADADDRFGSGSGDTIATGDLSGDGILDLVVASAYADGPLDTVANVGEVGVIFGPVADLGVVDLAARPPDILIYGRTTASLFGSAVMVQDMNGDGRADLVIGHPRFDRLDPNLTNSGEVVLFFGPLPRGTIDLALTEPDLVISSPGEMMDLGRSLSAADVSGDGVTDLVIGAPAAINSGLSGAGAVHAVYGPFAPGAPRDLAVLPADLIIHGAFRDGYLGDRVAAGDVSGDGVADIVAGGRGATGPTGIVDAGEAVVVFGGRPRGTVIDLALTAADVRLTGDSMGDFAGWRVATGDMTGDGVAELFVSRVDGTAAPDEVDVLLGPLVSGSSVDHVSTFPDITLVTSSATQFGYDLELAAWPAGGPLLVVSAGMYLTPVSCVSGNGFYVIDALPARGTIWDLSTSPPALTVGSADNSNIEVADLDGDGTPRFLFTDAAAAGPAGDRAGAYSVNVVRYEDRCEVAPQPLGPSGLHLTRAGGDVLLHFDEVGLGEDSLGVDVFRGTLSELYGFSPRYDYTDVPGMCGLVNSPAVDAGAAAPGMPDVYYLATRACASICTDWRWYAPFEPATDGPLGTPTQRPPSCP